MLSLHIWGCGTSDSQVLAESRLVSVDKGWSRTAVNATRHREHALASHNGTQYIGFYDANQHMVLGKRRLGETSWTFHTTDYQGNASDEHNTINLGIDGDGILHVAWDHHVNPLNYARAVEPGSLELGLPLTPLGTLEGKVTYPGFHALPDGDLLLSYRHGTSGRGSMVLNRYNLQSGNWSRLHDVLIDGEGQRNPYWQMSVDLAGVVHMSWVWRETSNSSTNHDILYARSNDGGQSWERSNGEPYLLPITESTAELVWSVPQSTNLINQTSMTANDAGHARIATYFREDGQSVTQLQLISFDGAKWHSQAITSRTTDFTLGGTGTRVAPLSRPLIVSEQVEGREVLHVVYRDTENNSRIMLASKSINSDWTHKTLTDFPVGRWEPGYDPLLWRDENSLHLFVQNIVGVGDLLTDGTVATELTVPKESWVSVLEVDVDSVMPVTFTGP